MFPSRALAEIRYQLPVTRAKATSPGVEPFLDAYRSQTVSRLLVWRSLYAVLTGPEVFPSVFRTPAVKLASNVPAPANLFSPSEFDRTRPPLDVPVVALLGFGPFQRLQLRKPGSLGVAAPDTFRLQGFAPSCRFTSSETSRPYFMPVTLLGFSFRAFPPRRAFTSFEAGPLRGVDPSACCTPGCPGLPFDQRASPSRLCSLRRFATAGSRG